MSMGATDIVDQLDGSQESESIDSRIIGFANLLRTVGFSLGTESTSLASRAISNLSAGDSVAFFWVLYSLFVTRHSQQEIFTQAFTMYWMYNGAISELLDNAEGANSPRDRPVMIRRLREALSQNSTPPPTPQNTENSREMINTYSDIEVLRHIDFAQMSEIEFRQALLEIFRLKIPFDEILSRRFETGKQRTRIDIRKAFREMASNGGDIASLHFQHRTLKRVPLVVLCDISGSMENYTRILLQFLYFLTHERNHVSVFLFGTRLSNITHYLKDRDPDRAISRVSQEVADWAGGTRIGACLRQFNRDWSRRLLGQNATVLILTDGLERGDQDVLGKEVRRLRARSRRLVWLNPLTGYAEYKPTATGAQILSRHADAMLPCHNLDSFKILSDGLSQIRRGNRACK